MKRFKFHIYPENIVLRLLLRYIVYPLLFAVIILYLLSYIVLLKTDKIVVIGNTTVYVSDNEDFHFPSDSIAQYVRYGIDRLRGKGVDTDLDTRIIFCHNLCEYRLRNFFMQSYSFAETRWVLNRIMVAPLVRKEDVEAELERFKQDTVCSPYYVDEIISHELTHIYQREKLGDLCTLWCSLFEHWKIEGFADYKANHSILRVALGEKMFMEGRYSDKELDVEESFFENYFVGRLRTDYLLNYKNVSEEEYWKTHYDVKTLDEEIRTALRTGEYKIFKQSDYE